jgi:hypothetical protein
MVFATVSVTITKVKLYVQEFGGVFEKDQEKDTEEDKKNLHIVMLKELTSVKRKIF